MMDFTTSLTDRTRTESEPASPADRVFQFISDPRHKENLSGRVRAACITCRRKKIKCSGEANCRTCQEKGVICEGVPDRKRPKRSSIDTSVLDPTPAGVEQVRKLSTTKKSSPKQRPGSLSRLANATKSSDSGYDSLSPATSSFEPLLRATTENTTTATATASKAPAVPFRVDIWDLGGGRRTKALHEAESTRRPSGPPRIPTQPEPPIPEKHPDEDDISWWNNTHRADPSSLNLSSTAARVVFGDSFQPSSRPTKPPKPTIDLDGMPIDQPPLHNRTNNANSESTSRRQTVQFPISSSSAGAASSQFDVLANQPGIFDDLALLLAARPENAAGGNGVSSWWDINTEIGTMLCQAGDVLKEGVHDVVQDSSPGQTEPEVPKKRPVAGNFYW